MAVEYIFVGSVLTFVTALSFNILGVESEFPKRIYYLMFGSIASFLCGFLLLSTDVGMMIPVMLFLWGLGLIDFVLVILLSFLGWLQKRKRDRGWTE